MGKIEKLDGVGNCGYYAIFEAFKFLGKDQAASNSTLIKNYPIERLKRIELIRFGKNVNHFVHHHDDTVPLILVQLLPEGCSHLFGLNVRNLNTKQDRIDAFMATIGNSIYTEEFDNQDRTRMKDRWYLEALSTCPLIAYIFNDNFTIYNVDAAMKNHFYQKNDQIFC